MLNITELSGGDSELHIGLSGDLDVNTSPELESYIFDRIEGVNSVVLDMRELNYISSAGIRVILKTDIEMRNRGSFIIENPNDTIYGIFKTVNFHKFLNIKNTSDNTAQSGQEDAALQDKGAYIIEPYEPAGFEKEIIPKILWAYFDNEVPTYLGIFDRQKSFVAFVTFIGEGNTARVGMISEQLSGYKNEMGSVIKALEVYFEQSGYTELVVYRFGADDEGFDRAFSENSFAGQKRMYHIAYGLSDLLQSKFYEKGESLSGAMSAVKTYNDLTESQRMMLMFNFGINSSNEIDVVFSNFFVSKDELKGILVAREVLENYLVVFSIKAISDDDTKMAIPLMIIACLNVSRTLLMDNATICFTFESEKQCLGLAKTLGHREDYDMVSIYNKYLSVSRK